MDREAIRDQWERDRSTFHGIVAAASAEDLRRPSQGTRWTNQQLLFHLVFGYQIVRALLVLVRLFGRLPDSFSRAFARGLNAATPVFDLVNYLGSCGGGLLHTRRMSTWLDHILSALNRSLTRATDAELRSGMHYPTRWDPYFHDRMSTADIYRFPARHFAHHQRQLTLAIPENETGRLPET